MNKFKIKKAFTLIELMVILAILSIVIWVWSQVNFNEIWDDNRLTIFNNKIISQYETLRNNTLLWKWIDSNIGVPDEWRINYSTSGSWVITPSYSSWASWVTYSGWILTPAAFHEIRDIECLDLSKASLGTWSSAEITINWNDFTLWWDCNWASRILKFTTVFKWDTSDIHINIINWLIEVQ
jgi:prepilin-type N-terminal cleavage/methylation domain-containing protein